MRKLKYHLLGRYNTPFCDTINYNDLRGYHSSAEFEAECASNPDEVCIKCVAELKRNHRWKKLGMTSRDPNNF
jgi:hypothetical protein